MDRILDWCAGRDLNPHVSPRQNLNLVRLPFRHLRDGARDVYHGRTMVKAQVIRDESKQVVLTVTVDGQSHEVTLSKADLARLGRSGESADAFVQRCFAFLLEREPKESILRRFDVSVIARYFPEFETEIRA